ATYTTSTLAVGNHTITAEYAGPPFFLTSSGSVASNPVVVNPADTTTRVTSSTSSTSTYGDAVLFTALVTANAPAGGTPSGTVTLLDGSPALATASLNSLGIATLLTSSLSASGTPHAITAVFVPGDGNYNASNSTASPFLQTVNQATLTVTADDQSRGYGDADSTFTASYAGFENGETLATSGVTGAPDLSTLADPSSPVIGSPYAIIASLGTLSAVNYAF